MMHSVVLAACLSLLFFSSYSCTKEKAGTIEPPPVQAEAPVAITSVTDAVDPLPGEGHYEEHCKVCHGAGGKGGIGPRLTDKDWKYGGGDEDLYYSVAKGRPGGMPSWDHTLSEAKIREIMQYIRRISEK